jgi:hypothetical protein
MEFLTIHELSRQFDTPARVIRYRFHKLRQAGKLTEAQDYRRDDLVDDQHFEWKINPVSFMHAAGMTLAATGPASALGNSPATKSAPLVAKVDNQHTPPVTQAPRPVTNVPETVAKPVTNELEREMITILKEQVKVKDGQISDLSVQVREVSEINVKLIGQTLQQSQHIQDLLRLTGGKMDFNDTVAKDGSQTSATATKVGNQAGDVVNHSDTKDAEGGYPSDATPGGLSAEQGSERAA